MDTLQLIKDIFHPNPYFKIEKNLDDTLLHISLKTFNGVTYILLASEINESTDIRHLIKSQKKELKKYFNANLLKGVGVLEIFIGYHKDWANKVYDIAPDWHGLQSVVLQGLLFIDPKCKQHAFTQSCWGPIKFGNIHGQIDKLHYFLKEIGSKNIQTSHT